jgi:hypothetical protein
MALGQVKVNGKAAAGAFYGYQPLVIKIATTNLMTATSGGTSQTDPLVEGGYDQAIRAVETLGSIVWAGAQDSGNDYVTVVVDAATFNAGAGATTSGAYGALKDALASALSASASDFTITTSSALNGAGTFTFA